MNRIKADSRSNSVSVIELSDRNRAEIDTDNLKITCYLYYQGSVIALANIEYGNSCQHIFNQAERFDKWSQELERYRKLNEKTVLQLAKTGLSVLSMQFRKGKFFRASMHNAGSA